MNHNHQTSAKELDQSIIEWLSDHSATIIVIATLGTFFLTGFLEFFHYRDTFSSAISYEIAIVIAIALPLVIQGIRCASVANSAKKFRLGQKGRGVFILAISMGATIYCSYEMGLLADTWESGHDELTGVILLASQFLVWAGYALEVVLVVSVSGEANSSGQDWTAQNSPQKEEEAFVLDPLLNGNGATH